MSDRTAFEMLECGPRHFRLLRTLTQIPLTARMPGLHGWLALTHGQAPQVAGAAFLRCAPDPTRAWLEVLPEWRRRGLGTDLLGKIAGVARQHGTTTLHGWQPVTDLDGIAFAQRRGMNLETHTAYEVDIDSTREGFAEAFQRLRSRGRIPAGLRGLYNTEAPLGRINRLLEPEFPSGLRQRLDTIAVHGLGPDDWVYALSRDDTLVAVGIGRFDQRAIWVDAYTVAPGQRGRWAAAAIRHLSFQHFLRVRPEITHFRFVSDDRALDTNKLVKRLGAEPVGTLHHVSWKVDT